MFANTMRFYFLSSFFFFFVVCSKVFAQSETSTDSIVYEYDTVHSVHTVNLYDSPVPLQMLYSSLGFVWQIQNVSTQNFSSFSNAVGSAATVSFAYESHVFETGISLLNNNQLFTKDVNSVHLTSSVSTVTDSSIRYISGTTLDTVSRYREVLPDTVIYHYVTTTKETLTKRVEYRSVQQVKLDSVVTKKQLALCNQYRIIEIPLRYGFRWRHKYFDANLKLGSLFRWIVYSSPTNINPLKDFAAESSDSFTSFYLGACADVSLQYLLTDKLFVHSSIKYTVFPSVKLFDKSMTIQTAGVYFGLSYIIK